MRLALLCLASSVTVAVFYNTNKFCENETSNSATHDIHLIGKEENQVNFVFFCRSLVNNYEAIQGPFELSCGQLPARLQKQAKYNPRTIKGVGYCYSKVTLEEQKALPKEVASDPDIEALLAKQLNVNDKIVSDFKKVTRKVKCKTSAEISAGFSKSCIGAEMISDKLDVTVSVSPLYGTDAIEASELSIVGISNGREISSKHAPHTGKLTVEGHRGMYYQACAKLNHGLAVLTLSFETQTE